MARTIRLTLIVATGLALLAFLFVPRLFRKELYLAACFENVRGLRIGAPVRIAGVEVGRVTAVRAQPDRQECQAQVDMTLSTAYELKVPGDARALVANDG